MIIFDASYLIAYLHPDPEPPKDRADKPVTKFRERISQLVAELNAAGQVIGIPTPALAEILVRAGKGKFRYLQTIGDAYRFEVLPFDQRAAIDAGELIALIKKEAKQPFRTWSKVKFDIQIAAIGKTAGVTIIYSDDTDIEAHGKRLNIPVKRICDLPIPPDLVEPLVGPQKDAVEHEAQGRLALTPPALEDYDGNAGKAESGGAIQAENTPDVGAGAASRTGNSTGTEATEAVDAIPDAQPEAQADKAVSLPPTSTGPPETSPESRA